MPWNLFIKKQDNSTINILQFKEPQEISVEQVKEMIKKRTGVSPSAQRLVFGSMELQDGKMISNYNISDKSTVHLLMRLHGGSMRPPQPYFRKINVSIPRTDKECMIMKIQGNNVQMPCGHAINPDALIDYAFSEVLGNKKTNIRCCACCSIWGLDVIGSYGGATEEEIDVLKQSVSLNFIQHDPKIGNCPSCQSLCERVNESNKCVICPICATKRGKIFYFCWDCRKEWIGNPRNEHCGNENCNNQEFLQQLMKCPLKEIKYINTKAPSIRACPSCGSLIEHAGECKHMQCLVCKTEFCFVCLKVRDGGLWGCGSYNRPCNVSPRQTEIPHRK